MPKYVLSPISNPLDQIYQYHVRVALSPEHDQRVTQALAAPTSPTPWLAVLHADGFATIYDGSGKEVVSLANHADAVLIANAVNGGK